MQQFLRVFEALWNGFAFKELVVLHFYFHKWLRYDACAGWKTCLNGNSFACFFKLALFINTNEYWIEGDLWMRLGFKIIK